MSDWGNAWPGQGGVRLSGPALSPFRQMLLGFRLQGRTIHALLIRELTTRFGRDSIGFLWIFFEPLFLASIIGAVHHFIRAGHIPGVPPFVFGIIGYAPFFAFRGMINQATSAIHSNITLLYHRQIKLMDIMMARFLLQSSIVVVVLTVMLGFTIWAFDMMPHSLPTLVGGLVLMLVFANGLAMLAAAACAVVEGFERIIHPLTYVAMPFSGAFFAMHNLPPSVREIFLWNPQPHFHEMMREGMFGHLIPSYYDLPYVLAWCVGLNLLGMMALRAARPKLEY